MVRIRPRSADAFTLIEMLTVMLIIGIITALIFGVAGIATKSSTAKRTEGEIKALSAACESYKADNGTYPRLTDTTEQDTGDSAPIDPRKDGNPLAEKYRKASVFLYQQLAGDADVDGKPADAGAKMYYEFKPASMGGYTPGSATSKVLYLQDPYGFSFGYSTAGARAEELYAEQAKKAVVSANGTVTAPPRGATNSGYNTTFDLWSTGGVTTDPPSESVRQRWIKNW